jgi:hypothetical protein
MRRDYFDVLKYNFEETMKIVELFKFPSLFINQLFTEGHQL